jgi:hypothetical protein
MGSTSPFRAQAQSIGKIHRVGILSLGRVSADSPDLAAFRERLGQISYADWHNHASKPGPQTGSRISFLPSRKNLFDSTWR